VLFAFALVGIGPFTALGLWLRGAPAASAMALLTAFVAIVWTYESLAETLRYRLDGLSGSLDEAQRARELESEQLRWTLDNVAQGVLTVEPDGELSFDRSAAVVGMFGEPEIGMKLWQYVARVDPAFAAALEAAWPTLLEEKLPSDLVLYQLPRRLSGRRRHFEIEYRPTLATDRLSSLLVVITDVTETVERERSQAREADTLGVFAQFVADRAGCSELFRDAGNRVRRLVDVGTMLDSATAQRELASLKTSAATLGVTSIATACHEIEARLFETSSALHPEDVSRIEEIWGDFSARLGPWLTPDASRDLQVNAADQEHLRAAILANAPRTELLWLVDRWRNERTQPRLARMAEQAKAMSRRSGKGEVDVVVIDEGARLEPACAAKFWPVFMHAVRNAVEHGLVPALQRDGRRPGLTLRAFEADGEIAIEVADDGRGIDWVATAAEARRMGLPASTRPELEAALMTDGFSTHRATSPDATRGRGLAVLRATCENLGGRVHIFSEPGSGTTVHCRLPGMGARPVTSLPPLSGRASHRRIAITGLGPNLLDRATG
jgi:signal transduction histidine kinase